MLTRSDVLCSVKTRFSGGSLGAPLASANHFPLHLVYQPFCPRVSCLYQISGFFTLTKKCLATVGEEEIFLCPQGSLGWSHNYVST